MQIVIHPDGTATCLYAEAIDLRELGVVSIRRASHVEPDARGDWHADLSPLAGPTLGPFHTRGAALAAEETWLQNQWLC